MFAQDEAVALREVVDILGTNLSLAILENPPDDAVTRDAMEITLRQLGSISKKLSISLAYLGEY
jgi:hypothetical protein